MTNIDQIMDMLDWNNPQQVQEKGRMLARNIRCINVFLQPGHPGHAKNVWDNCAKILSARTDDELQPYIYELLSWLKDMNWPGAECIYSRLERYQRNQHFEEILEECLYEAKALGDENWNNKLIELNTVCK